MSLSAGGRRLAGLVLPLILVTTALSPQAHAWQQPVAHIGSSLAAATHAGARLPGRGTHDPDGRWDEGFAPGTGNGINGPVHAMAVLDGDIYVGGEFTSAGGVPANNIARWDGNQWWPVGSGGGNGVGAAVLAMAVKDGDLYIGGIFRSLNLGAATIEAEYIAGWDGEDWFLLGSDSGNGLNTYVYALAAAADGIYVGGNFTQANHSGALTDVNHVARWDGDTWSALGSGGGNGLNGFVRALVAVDGDIYAGGYFSAANAGADVPANAVARWSGGNWTGLGTGSGNGVNGDVLALTAMDGAVYVGGDFTQANAGQPIIANRVARWDGSGWSALAGTRSGNGVNGNVEALVSDGAVLYVGGSFDRADFTGGNLIAHSIAQWDGQAWSALGSGIIGQVWAGALPDDSGLYLGGSFAQAGGKPSANIARYQRNGLIEVVVTGDGDGRVISEPAGIDCPDACSQALHWGSTITLTAEPEPGSTFIGWSGDACAGTAPCELTLEQDTTVTAVFQVTHYTLTYTAPGAAGTIVGQSPQSVPHGGDGSPVTAQPNTGYYFTQWSDGRLDNPRADTNVTGHVTVQAQFARFEYTVSPSVGGGQGTISPATPQTVQHGQGISFTLAPAFGYAVDSVDGTCGGTLMGTTFTTAAITADCTVVAHFIEVDFGLSLDAGRDYVGYGMDLHYVLVLTNFGDDALSGIEVTSVLPPQLDAASATWECLPPPPGGQCTASGTGAINDAGVMVPAGGEIVWTLSAGVLPDAVGGDVTYVVEAQHGAADPRDAWETAALVLFRNGFNDAGDDGANGIGD